MLEATDLRLTYGPTVALASAAATVAPGEVVALTGPSGSGKTSLLYCLAGLVRPDSGSVTFEGRDLTRLTDNDRAQTRRRHFGFVFQFAELVPELTLRENVELPLQLVGRSGRERRERVNELLERLDIVAEADRRPGQVSGGQAQRAAVARALAHTPDVVFADEPTGSLDSANGSKVLDQLLSVAREHGTAVVLVTHSSDVADAADRVVPLHDGLAG